MKFNTFKTNPAKEQEGTWIDIGEGAELLICRAGNPEHEAYLAVLERQYRGQAIVGQGELAPKVQTEIAIKALARCILKGYRGLTDDAGHEMIYSQEEAERLLRDAKDFRELVSRLSLDRANFRDAEVKEITGN